MEQARKPGTSVESFETYRPYLFAVAYRLLGSAMDAEDLVQETYLRFQAAEPSSIRSLKAYLTTILVRLGMDQLQLARRTREVHVGPWLPEPILTEELEDPGHPEKRVELEESISLAFLVLLEQLQPFERAVFLLHEVFEYPFAEIAAMLGKSEVASRSSFNRAKHHLQAHRPRFTPAQEMHEHLLASFLVAVQGGDMTSLTKLLAEEVTLWTDGGGKTRTAALRPIYGREAVIRISLKTKRFWPKTLRFEIRQVNGEAALVGRADNAEAWIVLAVEAEHGQIQAIRIIADPDKLTRI
jgi:RNA polymerase sigma-70 factor (ECF subfamily)